MQTKIEDRALVNSMGTLPCLSHHVVHLRGKQEDQDKIE